MTQRFTQGAGPLPHQIPRWPKRQDSTDGFDPEALEIRTYAALWQLYGKYRAERWYREWEIARPSPTQVNSDLTILLHEMMKDRSVRNPTKRVASMMGVAPASVRRLINRRRKATKG